MSSITIDRAFLRAFNKDAETALTVVAEKYGISVTYKGGNFARDGANATLKYEIAAPDTTTGETLSREAQDFKRFAHQYEFEAEDLGSEFTVRGTVYRITGLKATRRKYPISADRVSDGGSFKFTVEQVKGGGQPQFSEGLTEVIKEGFVRLAGELSPENLSCDGECSDAEVRKRLSNINRQWAELERRAGRKVSEDEAWRFHV